MTGVQSLSLEDRFIIFEQMNLHQQRIDAGWGRDQADAYVDLYWPEGKFTVIDLRHQTFEGVEGLKQMYDFAHSVFPIEKWSHDMGALPDRGWWRSCNRALALGREMAPRDSGHRFDGNLRRRVGEARRHLEVSGAHIHDRPELALADLPALRRSPERVVSRVLICTS